MTTFESLDELLRNLPNSNNKKLSLDDIYTMLSTLPSSILTCYAPNLSYEALFKQLESDSKVELEMTCNILDKLLNSVEASCFMSSFSGPVELGLHHHSPFVVYLSLEQLERVAKGSVYYFKGYECILLTLSDLLCNENTSIASKASTIFTYFGSCEDGLRIVFSQEMTHKLRKVSEFNDTTRFRVYETIVGIVIHSELALNYYLSQVNPSNNLLINLIQEMFTTGDKMDVLAQLNALEIVSKLTSVEHGYKLIEADGTAKKLEHLVVNCSDQLSNILLLPGIIKLFGSICCQYPKSINTQYRNFALMILKNINDNDQSILPIAVETLGVMATTVEGKLALSKLGTPLLTSVSLLGDMVVRGSTELKVRVLHALQHLFWVPTSKQTEEVLRVVEKWFNVVFEKNSVSEVQSICMQPYKELKTAGFVALNSIACLEVGQKALRGCAGFQEYLLNRRTDTSLEGNEAKFKVISTLASSPYTESVFGVSFKNKLLEYQSQGCFYSTSQSYPLVEGR